MALTSGWSLVSNEPTKEGGAMKWIMSSVAVLVAAVLSVGVAAQSNGTMGKGDKMNKMEMKDSTYTGCVETGSEPGSFTLTHLAAEDHMGKDAMKRDTMGKDTMKKDTMAKDSMSKDAIAPMAPMALSVTAWFGVRLSPSAFGIFDAFPDEAGRNAHLSGRVAAALTEKASELLAHPPTIEKVEVLAAKLPG